MPPMHHVKRMRVAWRRTFEGCRCSHTLPETIRIRLRGVVVPVAEDRLPHGRLGDLLFDVCPPTHGCKPPALKTLTERPGVHASRPGRRHGDGIMP